MRGPGPAKVSCQRSPGTHTDGQFQTFASGSYRRRQLTTVAVYSKLCASLVGSRRSSALAAQRPTSRLFSEPKWLTSPQSEWVSGGGFAAAKWILIDRRSVRSRSEHAQSPRSGRRASALARLEYVGAGSALARERRRLVRRIKCHHDVRVSTPVESECCGAGRACF